MSNQETRQEGISRLRAEVERRGGQLRPSASQDGWYEVNGRDGGLFDVKIHVAKTEGWRSRKSDSVSGSNSHPAAWVCIALDEPIADARIIDPDWMMNDAQAQLDQWLEKPGRSMAIDDHFAIRAPRVRQWKGSWGVIGLGAETRADQVTGRRVTENTLGAWVFKCNPDVYDLPSAIADGKVLVDNWSVVRNYRSQMFAAGQKAILWMSGDYAEYAPRGVWGIGWVTGERYEVRNVGSKHWLDKRHAASVELMAPNAITVLDAADRVLAVDIVNDPVLRAMEVFTSPRGSNPSWVTVEQLAALEKLLPPWPDPADNPTVPISVGPGGAGYGTPEHNKEVELAAMSAVTEYYERRWGAKVVDVSAKKLGWDLTVTSSEWGERHVEVKGTSGWKPVFLLTANELHSAENDSEWELAIVTSALTSKRFVNLYDAEQVIDNAAPHVIRVDLTAEEGWEA